jgi:hypothetical protein
MEQQYHEEAYEYEGKALGFRRLAAEFHRIEGGGDRPTPPRSYIFLCTICGHIYGRRTVAPTTDWPAKHEWQCNEGLCAAHGGGSLMHSREELYELSEESSRYPGFCPHELLKHETLIAISEVLNVNPYANTKRTISSD